MIEQNRIRRAEEGKIKVVEHDYMVTMEKEGEQIAAIPTDRKELQGYILAINQMLLRMPTVSELVEIRHEAGRIFEKGGK